MSEITATVVEASAATLSSKVAIGSVGDGVVGAAGFFTGIDWNIEDSLLTDGVGA